MQIPSVNMMFRTRAGAAGLPPAGSSGAAFTGIYADALQSGEVNPAAQVQELTILENPAAQASAQPKATISLPVKTMASATKAYGSSPMFIPASALPKSFLPQSGGDSARAAQVVAFAKQFVGTPYVAGGEDLVKGADCSGFVQSVYKQFGIKLPRSSYQQSKVGQEVSVNDLQPGDLVFFKNADYAPVTHVAMYIGDGKIIHASSVKTGVIISKLKITDDFRIARRLL